MSDDPDEMLKPYVPDVVRYDDAGVFEFVMTDALHIYEERDGYAVLRDEARNIVGVRWPIPKPSAALATAREEGRRAGLEEAAGRLDTAAAALDPPEGLLGVSDVALMNASTAHGLRKGAEIVRALSASPAPGDGWRPIETAPLEGELLLAIRGVSKPYAAVGCWIVQSALHNRPCWMINGGHAVHPHAWMPLPSPPSVSPVVTEPGDGVAAGKE